MTSLPFPLPRRSTLLRGTAANVASTLALAACSRRETGAPLAGINAVSHWAFGDEAARRDDFTVTHTVLGALTNQAASVFWAYVHERLFAARRRRATLPRVVGEAVATSALACAIDYTITPKRLTPGFELRLSRGALLVVYAAFAAGLAAASLLLPAAER